ncbi:MAG: hypothetical protein ACFCD0_16990 [Gemmataceae bacterium]
MMEKSDISPPGQHPFDSCKPEIDQLAHALERVQSFLKWIDEHHRSFDKVRNTDPESAESELHNLRDSTEQAVMHLQRLTELVLAGYAIDVNKVVPKDLCNESWRCWVQLLRRERGV